MWQEASKGTWMAKGGTRCPSLYSQPICQSQCTVHMRAYYGRFECGNVPHHIGLATECVHVWRQ